MSRPVIILLGLVMFSLLVGWAELRHLSQIEDNVELRSQQALIEANFNSVVATADGRDITLSGSTSDATRRVMAEALVADLSAVRAVVNDIVVPGGDVDDQAGAEQTPFVPASDDTVSNEAETPGVTEVAEVAEVAQPAPRASTKIQLPVLADDPQPEPEPEQAAEQDSAQEPLADPVVQAETVADPEPAEQAEPIVLPQVQAEEEPAPEQEPIAEAPYTLSVASRADGIFLSGMVASNAEKQRLEDQARLAFPEQTINNRLSVGAAALSTAESLAPRGLGMLTELSSGTLDVDQRGLRVNGRATSAERRDLLEQKLAAARRENPSLRIVSNIVVAGTLDNSSCQAELNRLIASEKILFENEKAEVNSESYDLLASLADVSQRCNARIEIGGHTDSYGDDAYNQWLSEQRAGAVKRFLVENGVSEQRLSSVGYGEAQPIAENTTRAQRAKNRRIEFRVITDQEASQ